MTDPENGYGSVSTADVFARVATRLEASEAGRSLWLKLEEEISASGVTAATSYVRDRFKQLSDRVMAALPPRPGS